ncbi:hypothetical protein C5167_007219 [Papaver somniferum]|uniref:Uncharacterized protein n=1 Tax=Papaver somniferum TaxID=3469 RepID=A0A4Y7JGN5_PAPSO|nr:hypothetical protein C5167_007219 [Papaver somniferum]
MPVPRVAENSCKHFFFQACESRVIQIVLSLGKIPLIHYYHSSSLSLSQTDLTLNKKSSPVIESLAPLKPEEVRKVVISPTLVQNPSPGNLQSSHLALHVNEDESYCSAFIASGCNIYKLEKILQLPREIDPLDLCTYEAVVRKKIGDETDRETGVEREFLVFLFILAFTLQM